MHSALPRANRISAATALAGLLAALLLAAGCVEEPESQGASQAGSTIEQQFQPTAEIPKMHPWLSWANLRLGMSNFDLSQAYNAPEGRGEGFTRVHQYFGAAVNQYITFDTAEGEPVRKLICALYRDELFRIVDRREGVNAEYAAEWLAECTQQFGAEPAETIGGAQWIWRDEEQDITVSFTQDNAGEEYMTTQLEITHMPMYTAWQAYNRDWAEKHE